MTGWTCGDLTVLIIHLVELIMILCEMGVMARGAIYYVLISLGGGIGFWF